MTRVRGTRDPSVPIHFSNSQFSRSTSAIARILYRGPGQARLSLSPPDTRGWRARGRCRRRFEIRISLRRCGSASRRATRTSFNVRAHLRPSSSVRARRKRNCCAGPRFRVCRWGFTATSAVAWTLPGGPLLSAGRPSKRRKHGSRSASSWQAARIGHRRSPGAARVLGRSVRLPPAGAASRLHRQTPHDDAPRSSRTA